MAQKTQIIDLAQDSNYDIVVNKNRTLNATLHCQYLSGDTYVDFSFDNYQYIIMHVKSRPDSEKVVLSLSNIASTLLMQPQGRLQFKAEHKLMDLRVGEYVYDIYVYNNDENKRAFLSGKFTVQATVTN